MDLQSLDVLDQDALDAVGPSDVDGSILLSHGRKECRVVIGGDVADVETDAIVESEGDLHDLPLSVGMGLRSDCANDEESEQCHLTKDAEQCQSLHDRLPLSMGGD